MDAAIFVRRHFGENLKNENLERPTSKNSSSWQNNETGGRVDSHFAEGGIAHLKRTRARKNKATVRSQELAGVVNFFKAAEKT